MHGTAPWPAMTIERKRDMETPEQKNRKTCPSCAESIPVAAKICPRCRQWLSFLSFRNPFAVVLFAFLPMFASMILFGYWSFNRLGKLFNPPPFYSDFQGSIQILDSKMKWVETSEGPRLFLTGLITNRSSMAWRRPEFECRFFNSQSQMVDAATGYAYLTILPGNDSAFRLSIKPLLSSNEYASFKLSLSTAYNARGSF